MPQSPLSSRSARQRRPARASHATRRAPLLALMEGLEGRRLMAVTTLSNGSGDGSLQITVDAYGAYGSSAPPADDALYNPTGPDLPRGSTFESGVYFSESDGFLVEGDIGGSGNLPSVNFTSNTGTVATSTFTLAGFNFNLTQALSAASPDGSTFTQTYQVRNDTGSPQTFRLVRHVDGDLFFVGGLGDDFAGVSADGQFVFEFDTATDPNASSAFFGITATGGTYRGYTIQEFRYTDDIVDDNGIGANRLNQFQRDDFSTGDLIDADADNDRLTDEGFDVTISTDNEFTLGAGESATYVTTTIFGQGPPTVILSPGRLQFDAGSYEVDENAGTATFTVERVSGSTGTVTVDFAFADGTALNGLDYAGTPGTLTFGNAERSKTITVQLLNDTLSEGDEGFNIVLSNPTGGSELGANPAAAVTILDDEATVQFQSATFNAFESDQTVQLTLVRNGVLSAPLTVDFATADGSATAGLDYTASTGTATFAAGSDTATVDIPISYDFTAETDETFTVTLSNPAGGAAVGALGTTTVTIIDIPRPPAVRDVRFITSGRNNSRIDGLVLTFSEAMNETTVEDLINYDLYQIKEKRFGGSPARKRVVITSAEYDPATTSVTLRTAKALKQNVFHEINANTTLLGGILTAGGEPLDGNLDALSGDDYQQYVARGRKLSYFDAEGDKVTLKVDQGAMELVRSVLRDAEQLRLVDAGGGVLTGDFDASPRRRQPDGRRASISDGRAIIRRLLGGDGVTLDLERDRFDILGTMPL